MTTVPDPRPPVWVGHVHLFTGQVEETEAFMRKIGVRPIFSGDGIAVMELRGGTHLVMLRRDDAEPGDVGFDLMVDDIQAAWADYEGKGLDPSPIEHGSVHDSFTLTAPGGHRITVNSSHVSSEPV